MNRILFERTEIVDGLATFGGARAEHVLRVLHGTVGQTLKTGVVDGPIGTSEIVRLTATPAPEVVVRVNHDGVALAPWVDVILAPPRPRILKRLLPQLAALGVGRLVLVGAKKVEKDFWGATLLREENYRPLLIDGLMQAGTARVPTLTAWKSFNAFLREGLGEFDSANRIVAHPYAADGGPAKGGARTGRLLLAIGPEGGWTEDEVAQLEERGFRRHSLGARILRTDTATVALLARLMPVEET